MFCPGCGKELDDSAVFCTGCGRPLKGQPANQAKPGDAPSGGFTVLGLFFPVVGFILFLVWQKDYPLRSKSCGKGALIGAIISAALGAIVVTFYIMFFLGLFYGFIYPPMVDALLALAAL